jgi:hypothetical protein
MTPPVMWETPRRVAVLAIATVVASFTIAGFLGYRAGQTPAAQIVFPPGTVITVSAGPVSRP